MAWVIPQSRKDQLWADLQDVNGRFLGDDEKALCDHQQRLRLLGTNEWSEEGLKSVDYRESMALSKEVHHLVLFCTCVILKELFIRNVLSCPG